MDASQGIQAQTLANYWLAFNQGLQIIPVLNKIDLPNAQIDSVIAQLESQFGIASRNVLKISAKSGLGVESLLENICTQVKS